MSHYRNAVLAQDFLRRLCAHPDWIYDLSDGILHTLPEAWIVPPIIPDLRVRGWGLRPSQRPVPRFRSDAEVRPAVPLMRLNAIKHLQYLQRLQDEGRMEEYIKALGKRIVEQVRECQPLMDELVAEGRWEAYLEEARSRESDHHWEDVLNDGSGGPGEGPSGRS